MSKTKNKRNIKEQREALEAQVRNLVNDIKRRAEKEKILNAQLDACSKIICAMSSRIGEEIVLDKSEISNAPEYLIKNEPGRFIFKRADKIQQN